MGLVLFAVGTVDSFRRDPELRKIQDRYFWWESFRLDSDPLNRHPKSYSECEEAREKCSSWDLRAVWVDPGWLAKTLMLTAFPAFFVGAAAISGLGRLGVNEVWTFFIVMPPLIAAWYCCVGWLLDRRRLRRACRT